MESTAARNLEEKSSSQNVKAILQKILSAMNNYIREKPAKVKSPTSARLIAIKKIATAIYSYYDLSAKATDLHVTLMNDFDKNLSEYFANLHKTPDTASIGLLPELKDSYKSNTFPHSLHELHSIFALIESEIKAMPPTRFNGTELGKKLIDAISGYGAIMQTLSCNAYIAVYSVDIAYTQMTNAPAEFANCLYEALTASRIYRDGLFTHPLACVPETSIDRKEVNDAPLIAHVVICSSKDEVQQIIDRDHPTAGCFGAEFSYSLVKQHKDDDGQYIPLLASVVAMDIWEKTQSRDKSNQYPLAYLADKKELVITKSHAPVLRK